MPSSIRQMSLSSEPEVRMVPYATAADAHNNAACKRLRCASTNREATFGGSARDDLAALIQSFDRPDIAVKSAGRWARPDVINCALRDAFAPIVRNGAAAMPKVRRVPVAHREAQAFRSFRFGLPGTICRSSHADDGRNFAAYSALAGAGHAALRRQLVHDLATHRVVAPLAKRGLIAAWIIAYIFCLRDLGISLVVFPPGFDTLPVRILTLMANGAPSLIAELLSD
jgi:hypothetical protein